MSKWDSALRTLLWLFRSNGPVTLGGDAAEGGGTGAAGGKWKEEASLEPPGLAVEGPRRLSTEGVRRWPLCRPTDTDRVLGTFTRRLVPNCGLGPAMGFFGAPNPPLVPPPLVPRWTLEVASLPPREPGSVPAEGRDRAGCDERLRTRRG